MALVPKHLQFLRRPPLPLAQSQCPPTIRPSVYLSGRYAATPMTLPTDELLKMKIPHVLTVAGSDSGAGAGIQADLKTCAARGVFCSTVITALTAQNTVGVQEVNVMPEDVVAEQLRSVLSDMQVDVILPKYLWSFSWSFRFEAALVVDPVMISTSGDTLTDYSVLEAFREGLLPMADIVTPNLKEASMLLNNLKLDTIPDMRSAAKLIHDMGPKCVLVKGGDLPTSFDAVDVFFDGSEFYEFIVPRIETRNTHGTGCTLASCIAAELAKGLPMLSAVKVAKRYVETALMYGKDMAIGKGPQGPFDHLLKLKDTAQRSSAQHVFRQEDLFLYAVTDSRMNKRRGHSITDAVKEAIEGGATIVQLREKDLETSDFLAAAHECVAICRSKGIPILINDRIDIALACDADGVHIGQSDMPTFTARALLGPEKIIGVSCKTVEQANRAWKDGADYIGCGGVFPTNTKANNITVGLDGLQTVCLASKLPVVAIGGINASNAHSVMELGNPNLKGIAVVSALFDRECVLTETKKLHALLTKAVSKEINIDID